MERIGDGLLGAIVFCCICAVIICFGAYALVDWLFIFDGIKSDVLITPEIQIVVVDNVVDTLYIYKNP